MKKLIFAAMIALFPASAFAGWYSITNSDLFVADTEAEITDVVCLNNHFIYTTDTNKIYMSILCDPVNPTIDGTYIQISTGYVPQTFDDLADGGTNKGYTTGEQNKLAGIALGATANDTDANLKDRANHTGTQAMSTVTGLTTALAGKNAVITAGAHVNDGATNAAVNAATNAPTNLNVLTTLLGSLTGEVNATNTKQNDLATKYNDLAGKYNDLSTKFNTLLDRQESAGIVAP